MELPKRKNTRLKNYDYSLNGCYFITVCIKNRLQILGTIKAPENQISPPVTELSEKGKIVDKYINMISQSYENVFVDNYVIMPDHIHLLVSIEKPYICVDRKDLSEKVSVSTIIKALKTLVTKEIKESIWQKSFYDEIIENEKTYIRASQYIDDNPVCWFMGKHNDNVVFKEK